MGTFLVLAVLLGGIGGCSGPAGSARERSRGARAAVGAHHLCAGLWVVGRDHRRSAAEVLRQDIAPFEVFGWEGAFAYEVDEASSSVTVTAPGGISRTARHHGDQGCTILPEGAAGVYFEPVDVPRVPGDPDAEPWPAGHVGASEPYPPGIHREALEAALDRAMARKDQNTRALAVAWRDRIVGERYAPGWGPHTPQIGWSQGKSVTAALVGVLVRQGQLEVDAPAPVPRWRGADDPRAAITLRHLLNMSSGLDFARLDAEGPLGYSRANEHERIYFDAVDVFELAVEQPLAAEPGTRWAYRNGDPLVLGKVVRDIVEARGGEYLSFPQRALFDRIGARDFVLETDAWGNFILTGYDYGSAHDWLRFGLLHLDDGVWRGERVLPEGWVELVSSPAPAHPEAHYGGLFWTNAGGYWEGLPRDAYWADGYMGQVTMVIPSREVVIVRLGPSPEGFHEYFGALVGEVLEALSAPGSSAPGARP